MAQPIDTSTTLQKYTFKILEGGAVSLGRFTRGEGLSDLTAHYYWKAGPCDLNACINVVDDLRRSKELCGMLKFTTGVLVRLRSMKHGSPVRYGDKNDLIC